MEYIVKKGKNILSSDKITQKSELIKLNGYLKKIQESQHLCFDCGKDIAKCIKIMDHQKKRLDEAYDFITEGYQKVDSNSGKVLSFTVTKCADYKKPLKEAKTGPSLQQKKDLKIGYVNHIMGDREGTDYAITADEADAILEREMILSTQNAIIDKKNKLK